MSSVPIVYLLSSASPSYNTPFCHPLPSLASGHIIVEADREKIVLSGQFKGGYTMETDL